MEYLAFGIGTAVAVAVLGAAVAWAVMWALDALYRRLRP